MRGRAMLNSPRALASGDAEKASVKLLRVSVPPNPMRPPSILLSSDGLIPRSCTDSSRLAFVISSTVSPGTNTQSSRVRVSA